MLAGKWCSLNSLLHNGLNRDHPQFPWSHPNSQHSAPMRLQKAKAFGTKDNSQQYASTLLLVLLHSKVARRATAEHSSTSAAHHHHMAGGIRTSNNVKDGPLPWNIETHSMLRSIRSPDGRLWPNSCNYSYKLVRKLSAEGSPIQRGLKPGSGHESSFELLVRLVGLREQRCPRGSVPPSML